MRIREVPGATWLREGKHPLISDEEARHRFGDRVMSVVERLRGVPHSRGAEREVAGCGWSEYNHQSGRIDLCVLPYQHSDAHRFVRLPRLLTGQLARIGAVLGPVDAPPGGGGGDT